MFLVYGGISDTDYNSLGTFLCPCAGIERCSGGNSYFHSWTYLAYDRVWLSGLDIFSLYVMGSFSLTSTYECFIILLVVYP